MPFGYFILLWCVVLCRVVSLSYGYVVDCTSCTSFLSTARCACSRANSAPASSLRVRSLEAWRVAAVDVALVEMGAAMYHNNLSRLELIFAASTVSPYCNHCHLPTCSRRAGGTGGANAQECLLRVPYTLSRVRETAKTGGQERYTCIRRS